MTRATRLTELGAATLFEAAGKKGALPPRLRPVTGGAFAGPARTARVPAGENLTLHHMVPTLRSGEVLVVDGGGHLETALWGDVMAAAALTQGCAGLVVDGAIRDATQIQAMGLSVHAAGLAVPGPAKDKLGETDISLVLGAACVSPGDWIIADADGVVCVAQADLDAVIAAAEARATSEAALIDDLRSKRTTTLTALGLREAVSAESTKVL